MSDERPETAKVAEVFAMPILGERDERKRLISPAFVFSWPVTDAHRIQARSNHGQTLERLKERGGLCWQELRWVLKGLRWEEDSIGEDRAKADCLAMFPQVKR